MNNKQLIAPMARKVQEDARITKILSKTKTTTVNPKPKILKSENKDESLKDDLRLIQEKSKVAFNILNEVNKLCDEREGLRNLENSPERYYVSPKKITQEDIKRKNKEIKQIMESISHGHKDKGLLQIIDLENELKKK